MNVLILAQKDTIHKGFHNALKFAGINSYLVDGKYICKLHVKELLETNDIDTIMCYINHTVRNLPVEYINSKKIRVICWAQASYGDHVFDPYFTECASQEDVDTLLKIDNVLMWAQHEPDIIKSCFNKYQQVGLRLIYCPHAADTVVYRQLVVPNKIKISYIGGVAHKLGAAQKFLLPLVKKYKKDFIIYGDSAWQNLGVITKPMYNTDTISTIVSNSYVCPNIQHEALRHSNAIVNERSFFIAACGGFQVTDVEATRKFFDCPVAKTPYEFINKVNHYIENPSERSEMIRDAYENVMTNHTYFHRLADMFDVLKIEEKSEQLIKAAENIYKERKLCLDK